MLELTTEYIQYRIADSGKIFQNGQILHQQGLYHCAEADIKNGAFAYEIDGNYGDYTTRVQILSDSVRTSCNCPYPGKGCKHTVAVLLDAMHRINAWQSVLEKPVEQPKEPGEAWLSADEIREQAIADRHIRAKKEPFQVTLGDMLKGVHLIETPKGKQYRVTLHNPLTGAGHCSCPDFLTNRLGICKHLIHITDRIKKEDQFQNRIDAERFPFIDIYWDSISDTPRLFSEIPETEQEDIQPFLASCFHANGEFVGNDIGLLMPLITHLSDHKRVRIQESVIEQVDRRLMLREMETMSDTAPMDLSFLKTGLYPYQEAGVRFALHRPAALIGDQMGLGKTLQAIVVAILKKQVFGFNRILVVTLASLKDQWKREIERFTTETATIITGPALERQRIYLEDASLFKITNYETVLRDTGMISRFEPDLVILDEAQRIKNFETKTAQAIKSLPRKHSLVLTGTPLENRLEDVYSIIQFLDSSLLSPLWRFAADYFMLSRAKKGKLLGYRNLDRLHETLKPVVIRRRREEVLDDLPEEVVNTYFIDLDPKQRQLHAGFSQSLLPLMNKKFLTPMDLRRIQELLMCMRRVCDSTYLIDRKTQISPKLVELQSILEELVLANGRKVVIFSEWTTMTFLIGKLLSDAGIPFVELTGKVPVPKRQALIDAFTQQPDCKVFLSTDAGGTGLNLQAGDCVINFDLPWNPAKLNQRIGRVSRIGQKSSHVHVVNLVAKDSIEEKILAGIQLKSDVFKGVFDGGVDIVEFSQEKRTALLNQLREILVEEPVAAKKELENQPEIPEDTPHFLNPEVLDQPDAVVTYDAEETPSDAAPADNSPAPTETASPPVNAILNQPPERVEAVLNAGMQFIGGLLEMATGQPIALSSGGAPMVQVDRERGEITLKFRLPGF